MTWNFFHNDLRFSGLLAYIHFSYDVISHKTMQIWCRKHVTDRERGKILGVVKISAVCATPSLKGQKRVRWGKSVGALLFYFCLFINRWLDLGLFVNYVTLRNLNLLDYIYNFMKAHNMFDVRPWHNSRKTPWECLGILYTLWFLLYCTFFSIICHFHFYYTS